MSDNRGFSLVELLVAIAIGVVVSGCIASLLMFSLRMYGKQTVDVQMQQEMQTTSNIIIDSIMESNSFIVSKSKDSNNVDRTDVAILGKFEYTGASPVLSFTGYVFCVDGNVDTAKKDGKIYMKNYPATNLPAECVNAGTIVPAEVVAKLSDGVVGNTANLLAINAQAFDLSVASDSIDGDYYKNPFSVNLDLQFAKNSGINDVKKELHDTIAIRNTLRAIDRTSSTVEMTPVCVKEALATDWEQYKQPVQTSKKNSDDELTVTTEEVQMEQALGTIQVPGSGGGFTILEIVPDYSDDYIQLGIGSSSGACLDYANTHYGDPSFNRLTADDVYNYFKGFSGAGESAAEAASKNFFINNGVSIPGMVFLNSSEGVKTINNEVFKLNILSDVLEAGGTTLHKDHGIWDFSKHDYCEVNRNALRAWEASHSLVLNVCRPKDLRNNPQFLQNVDMIVFACPSDGGFNSANALYNKIKNTARNSNPGDSGDITWDEAKTIYKLVADEKASIACPSAMNNVSNVGVGPNMNALFKMLYYVRKKSVVGADDNNWNCNFKSDISKGSGRDVFRNVNSIQEVEDLLTVLVARHYDSNAYTYRTDLADYDYDNMGPKMPSVYRNQLVYNNDAVLMHYMADGTNGMLGLKAVSHSVGPNTSTPTSAPQTFGSIEIVGASLDGDNGRYVPVKDNEISSWGGLIPWGWLSYDYTYPARNVSYQIDVAKLSVPIKVNDGGKEVEIDKVLYLNEYEYKIATSKEARVFCVVNCTNNYNSLFINEKCVPINFEFGSCPFVHCGHKTGVASTYKPEPNQKVDGKDVTKVMECQIDMKIADEAKGTGVFDNYIKVTAIVDQSPELERNAETYPNEHYGDDRAKYPGESKANTAIGTDYAFVVVRDLFDLD